MAREINSNPVVLKGREAKRVLEKTKRTNRSVEYKAKMDRYVAFFKKIEENSKKSN